MVNPISNHWMQIWSEWHHSLLWIQCNNCTVLFLKSFSVTLIYHYIQQLSFYYLHNLCWLWKSNRIIYLEEVRIIFGRFCLWLGTFTLRNSSSSRKAYLFSHFLQPGHEQCGYPLNRKYFNQYIYQWVISCKVKHFFSTDKTESPQQKKE